MKILSILLSVLFVTGCAILKPVEVKRFGDTSVYTYAFVEKTQVLSSGVGAGYGGYGVGGGAAYSVAKSINPADVISGILMKKGFIVIDTITEPSQTLIVKYAQGDKRNVLGGIGGYTLEASIQVINANQDVLFFCNAEGQGSTESDDIREAITRCLKDL